MLPAKMRLTAVSLFTLLVLSVPAHADSDGCYCTSKGYIAYELRAAIRQTLDPNGETLKSPHVLRVVRMNEEISEEGEVGLQDFQVHELHCAADTVTIAGYDKTWMKYVVDISLPGRLLITEHVEESRDQHPLVPGSRGPTQLIGRSPEQVITVVSTDPQSTYQLVIMHSGKANDLGTDKRQRGFEYENRAELRRLDSHGTVLQRLLLYHDHFTEFGDYSK